MLTKPFRRRRHKRFGPGGRTEIGTARGAHCGKPSSGHAREENQDYDIGGTHYGAGLRSGFMMGRGVSRSDAGLQRPLGHGKDLYLDAAGFDPVACSVLNLRRQRNEKFHDSKDKR